MKTITQLEMNDGDIEFARIIASCKGFKDSTAYTSNSDMIGLHCLPLDNTMDEGCIVKTLEFGMIYIETLEIRLNK